MYKLITIAIFFIFSVFSFESYAINYSKGSYKKALKESKSAKKDIAIFFNLPNNNYCQEIETDVFGSSRVIEVYDKNFINLKINPNTKEGAKLAKKFSINAYPSIIFINYKEERICKVIGVNSNIDVLKLANNVISGDRTLKYYDDLFAKNPDKLLSNRVSFLEYIDLLYNAGEDYNDKVEMYFSTLRPSEFKSPENVDAIIKYSEDIYSPEFDYFARNISKLNSLHFNSNDMYLKLENVIANHILDYIYKNKDINPTDTMNVLFDVLSIENRELIESRVMLDYYSYVKSDKTLYTQSLRMYMPLHIRYLSTEQIIDYCNQVLESNDKELVEEAILWTEEKLNDEANFDLYYIRVQLMIKAGRISEARDETQRIRELLSDGFTMEMEQKLHALKFDEMEEEQVPLKIVR